MSIFRADLHVHTSDSADGRYSLEVTARAARLAGAVAVTVPILTRFFKIVSYIFHQYPVRHRRSCTCVV